MERKNAWNKYPEGKRGEVFAFAEKYKEFISKSSNPAALNVSQS